MLSEARPSRARRMRYRDALVIRGRTFARPRITSVRSGTPFLISLPMVVAVQEAAALEISACAVNALLLPWSRVIARVYRTTGRIALPSRLFGCTQ